MFLRLTPGPSSSVLGRFPVFNFSSKYINQFLKASPANWPRGSESSESAWLDISCCFRGFLPTIVTYSDYLPTTTLPSPQFLLNNSFLFSNFQLQLSPGKYLKQRQKIFPFLPYLDFYVGRRSRLLF